MKWGRKTTPIQHNYFFNLSFYPSSILGFPRLSSLILRVFFFKILDKKTLNKFTFLFNHSKAKFELNDRLHIYILWQVKLFYLINFLMEQHILKISLIKEGTTEKYQFIMLMKSVSQQKKLMFQRTKMYFRTPQKV
jgi:hypothetical protein